MPFLQDLRRWFDPKMLHHRGQHQLEVDYLAAKETDSRLVLHPDGSYGVEWVDASSIGTMLPAYIPFGSEIYDGNHASITIWMPDAPPLIAGNDDDEFDGNSGGVPSGWTEADIGGVMTVDEDEAGLELNVAAGVFTLAGIYKSIPAGDFTIWTKMSLSGQAETNNLEAGLALWDDAASSTADIVTFTLLCNATATEVRVVHWAAYNTSAGAAVTANAVISVDVMPTHIYLRIRRTSTTYGYDFSSDGIGWTRLHSGSVAFTPDHYGPVIERETIADNARFAFFRYVPTDVGITGLVSGDRVKLARNL